MRKLRRNSGASIAVILVVIVLISVLGTSLVSLTVDMGAVQPATLDAAKAFYAAESGLAIANVQQTATTGPVSYEGLSFETTKAGDTYTTTVSKDGQVLRVIQSDIADPVDDNPGGPLDEAASAGTVTTGTLYDPAAGWIGTHNTGEAKRKSVMKLVNPTIDDLTVVAFELSAAGTQPDVKRLSFMTAATGWDVELVWSDNDGLPLPTGRLDLDSTDPDEVVIPAGSYILVDDLEFKAEIDPYVDVTLTIYFSSGESSEITIEWLNDEPPAEPLDEAGSAATAFTDGSFTDPLAGDIDPIDDQIALKLMNESATEPLAFMSFSLSCTTAQPKLKQLKLRTPTNQWDANVVWLDGSGVDLPTGTIDLTDDHEQANRVIPAGGYMWVDTLEFKDAVEPGTFTLTVNFYGGATSVVTFTIP